MKRLVAWCILCLLFALPSAAQNIAVIPLEAGSAQTLPASPCQQNFVPGSNTLLLDTYICPPGGTLEWMKSLPDTYNPSAFTPHGTGACALQITWWPPAGDIGGGCWAASITAYPETNATIAQTGPYDGDNWLTTQPQILVEGTKQQLLTITEGHPYTYTITGITPQNAQTGHPCSQDGIACVGASMVILVSWDITPGVCLGGDVINWTQAPRIKRVKLQCPST